MSSKIDSALRGFALPWFTADDITSKPTQAGERPGVYEPNSNYDKGHIEVTHAQGADLSMLAVQGGGYDFAEFAVRKQAQTLPKEYAQWVAPNMLCDYHFIESTVVNVEEFAPVVIPSTQALFVLLKRASGAVADLLRVCPFNQTTQTFDASIQLDPNAPATIGLSADVLPDGRLYCITATSASSEEGILSYVSEDGLAWDRASSIRRFGGSFAPNDVATAQSLGNILAVFEDITGKMRQYVSTSLAGSFELVGEFAAISDGESVDCTSTSNGIFLVTYLANGTSKPTVARLGSASEALDTAQKITLDASAYLDVAICNTAAGVFVYARQSSSSIVDVFYSSDEGTTFTKMDRGAHSTVVSTRYMEKFKCVAYQGKVALPFRIHNGGTPAAEGAAMLFYGGWQNIAISHAEQASSSDILGRGSVGSGGNDVHTGIPLDLPHNVGWTQTTTGGTMAITNGGLRIVTVAQTNYETINPASTGDATLHLWKLEVQSGGSQVNDSCAYSYNTLTSKWSVRYSATGFTVVDTVAAVNIATVTLDMTESRIFKVVDRIIGSTTRVITLAHRLPGAVEWTVELYDAVLNTGGVFVAVEINFGHISSNTTTSRWEIWGYTRETAISLRTSEHDSASPFGLIGHKLLRPTPMHSSFYGTDGKATFLRMSGGSFHRAESGNISRSFDYAIERALPQESPSPQRTWRSISKSPETTIEFTAPDMSGLTSRLGNSWSPALFIANANFSEASLDYWNGLAWVTIGTWQGFSNAAALTYSRNGSTITPAAGTVSIGHYIKHGQYTGGHALFPGTGVGRRIARHGAGVWSDVVGSLAPKAVINLEGSLVGDPASGTAYLSQSSALLIAYTATPVYATKWRVRIAANLTSPDTYYEAGIIAPMYFVPIGQQWSNGYSVDGIAPVQAVTDRNNTEYRESRGIVKRVWTLPYADGNSSRNVVTNHADPDYLAPASGLALAAAADVFPLLLGLLRESGGHVPIVAVRSAPQAGGMVHGVDDYLYGYLDGPAGYDNTAGDDTEATEYNRGTAIRVVEIV